MNTLKSTLVAMRALKHASSIRVGRNFSDFFADRVVQALSQPDLLRMFEHLAKSLDADASAINATCLAEFLTAAAGAPGAQVLGWMRQHPRVAAMVATVAKNEDFSDALEAASEIFASGATSIVDDASVYDCPAPSWDIALTVTMHEPLAHGGDIKAGNATLFRRQRVMTSTGRILSLPFYAGNAIRGQLRDLLADHLVQSLGMMPRRDKPPLELWFFHVLYAGGVLEEQSKVMSKINAALGKHGAVRTDGLRELRDRLPALSLLGSAIGNKIINGRCCVTDLRPHCREWGTGEISVHQLFDWSFLTRREDYEGRGADDDHTGMIASTEVLQAGTVLSGGIDIDSHAGDMERSALGCGLHLLRDRGYLGAENRRGHGKCQIDIAGAPDPQPYRDYLHEHRQDILDYLVAIGGVNALGL